MKINNNFLRVLISVLLIITVCINHNGVEIKAANLSISESGIELIKELEGFEPNKEWDYKQWSIGYGSRVDADDYPNGITKEQADALLRSCIVKYVNSVNKFLDSYNISVSQNQFDALVSFTYNLGEGVWAGDFKLKQYLINGIHNYTESEIRTAFGNWCKAGGVVNQGLVNRRNKEATYFLQNMTPPVVQEGCWPLSVDKNVTNGYEYGRHYGYDFATAEGTPIYASFSGTVYKAQDLTNSYGKHVVVESTVNGKKIFVIYAHMSKRFANSGESVRAGQQIGEVGSTGNSTGNHLHFEVREGSYTGYPGNTRNPGNYISKKGNPTELSQAPIGNVDGYSARSGSLHINGWAADLDCPSESLTLRAYIDGEEPKEFPTTGHRTDLPYEGLHGFDVDIPTSAVGWKHVTLYALDKNGQNHGIIGSFDVQFPDRYYNPIGVLDECSGVERGIRIQGWAVDEDEPSKRLIIRTYIGDTYTDIETSTHRTDAPYSDTGFHGFDNIITTNKTGVHSIRIYALNVGGGEDLLLGEFIATFPEINPQVKLKLHVWHSCDAPDGSSYIPEKIDLDDTVYLNYKITDADGNIVNVRDLGYGDYTVKLTIYYPDGSVYRTANADNEENWIRIFYDENMPIGTYKGEVSIGGSITGEDVEYWDVTNVEPEIITQPTNANILSGETATFNVEAKGTNLRYQWYICESLFDDGTELVNVANISGANTAQLVIENCKTVESGQYFYCKVYNEGNDPISTKRALLDVKPNVVMYTVTYDANGGIGAPETQYKVESEPLELSSKIPSKFGYTFTGWAYQGFESATHFPGQIYTGSANLSLKAVWEPSHVLINQLPYEATGKIDLYGSCRYFKFTPAVSDTYAFESILSSGDTCGYLYDSLGNQLLYDDEGGNGSNFSLTYNLDAGKTYYYAVKWYYSDDIGDIPVKLSRKTAEPVTYTVTYDYKTNGGTSASKTSATVNSGELADLGVTASKVTLNPGNDTTAPWEFVGWNTNPDATIGLAVCRVTDDVTLYAIFKRNIVASFYEGESGELNNSKTITSVIYNDETYAEIKLPAINSYSGWTTDKWRTYTKLSNFMPETSDDFSPQSAFNIYGDAKFYATYTRSITLSYDANGGTGAPASQTQRQCMYAGRGKDSVTFAAGSAPEKTGYIFAGWKASNGTLYQAGENIDIEESTVLTAQWTVKPVGKHNVTYNYSYNGGTSADKTNDSVAHGEKADLGVKAYKSGWTFVGWNTDFDAKEALSSCIVTDNITLYAVFKKDIVAKFYEGESGILQTNKTKTATIYNRETSAKIVLPSASAYDGWESEKWRVYIPENPDVVLTYYDKMIHELSDSKDFYAIYTRSITLSYDANGGTGAPASQTQTQYMYAGHGKDSVTFAAGSAPEKTGYIFAGWKASNGILYQAGENIDIEESTVLTAQWTVKPVEKHNVTYNYSYNGGTSADKTSDSVAHGEKADLGVKAYKSGWTFVGWNTDKNARSGISSYTVNSDVTLYAIYKKSLTGKFYSGTNHSVRTLSADIYNNETSVTITMPELQVYSGWSSCGWREDKAAGKEQYSVGETVTISSDKTYYGVYDKKINLSYDSNGGTPTPEGESAQIYLNAGGYKQKKTFKLADSVSKEYYTFGGWAAGSVSGVVYEANSNIEISEDTTMYAVWSSNVSWNINSSGVLSITGKGPMIFPGYSSSPWSDRRDEIKKIVISEGITTICRSAFVSCKNVSEVEIADSVTTIGDYAFSYCDGLKSIFIPENVSFISENALDECDTLSEIRVSAENQCYTSSGGILFSKDMKSLLKYPGGKKDITEYIIPATVTDIGNNAFSHNYYLKNVIIPEGIKKIGDFAFYNCWDIIEAYVPESVEIIGKSAFAMCYDLVKIDVHPDNENYCSEDGVLLDKEKTILYQYPCSKNDVAAYIIPDTVKTLKNYSFRGASKLSAIVIPQSVTNIEYYVFYGCNSLKDVYYCASQSEWQNKVVVDSSGNTPLQNATMNYNYVQKHTVTYNYSYNGGTSSTKTTATVSHSQQADLSAKAFKSGWEFVGWNTDRDAKEAMSSYVVKSDIQLYAIYKKAITAGFHFAGDNNYQTEERVIYNNQQTAEFNVPTSEYEGWTFEGWRTDSNAAQATVNGSVSLTEDEEYYAVYSRDIFLKYEADNGMNYVSSSGKQYLNASGEKTGVTFTLESEPAKQGCEFKGWAVNGVNGDIYKPDVDITITESTTMYAVWSKIVELKHISFGVGSDTKNYKISARVQGLNETATVVAALYDQSGKMLGAVTEEFVINGTTNLLLKKNSDAYIIKLFVLNSEFKPLSYVGTWEVWDY